jgi:hypothetical protein
MGARQLSRKWICTCSNKEGSPANDYPPGGLARTLLSSSTGRRRNRRRGSAIHMQYMRKARSLSSRAVLPAHVAPNSLLRAELDEFIVDDDDDDDDNNARDDDGDGDNVNDVKGNAASEDVGDDGDEGDNDIDSDDESEDTDAAITTTKTVAAMLTERVRRRMRRHCCTGLLHHAQL